MLTVRYKEKDIKDIMCMEDFYMAVGLIKFFKNGSVTNVSQMSMNKYSCERILEIMKSNYLKNDKINFLVEKRAHTACAMDWMNYSPVSRDEIPENEIWIELHIGK